MSTHLIALYSDAPGSGKSTVREHLVRRGWVFVSFAGTLKSMTCMFLQGFGLSDQETTRRVYGTAADKAELIPGTDYTTRHVMQTLGTNWGRKYLSEDVWVNLAKATISLHLRLGRKVVLDDMRFPNECRVVKELGGKCWGVARPGLDLDCVHASEGALSELSPDILLYNNGTIEELLADVDSAMVAQDMTDEEFYAQCGLS